MNIETRLTEVKQEYLSRILSGNGTLLHEVERYLAAVQGKMLRPRLLLSAAATLGEEAFLSRRTLLLAVAVEMVHNASLLHDDVVDHATDRRGRPSVNHHWSNAIAVLVGDYFLTLTMQLIYEVNDADASNRINRTVAAMVEAELLAQELHTSPTPRSVEAEEAAYLQIIDGKTARLFATACALGNPDFEEYGLHYGRLFQLRDDMADGEATSHTERLIAQETALLRRLTPLPNISL